MVDAIGPVFTGGFEAITVDEDGNRYAILYLPDRNNDELQRAGKPPVYYWMPNQVRLARKGGKGDYKFHLLHFVGVQSSETTVGVEGTREVAGGMLSLTTTSAFPPQVLERAQEQLLKRFKGKDLNYWGWRSPAAPMFRPMPIVSSTTALSNLSPRADGSLPAEEGETPPPAEDAGAPRSVLQPRFVDPPRTVPHGRAFRGPSSNLDAWYSRLDGQGPGSIVPSGENAFSGLLGSLPTAILWQGFHGTFSPVSVIQTLGLAVWSQSLYIKIEGNWDRIFRHFSAAAAGRAWWFSADIQAEFNKLRLSGGITVEMEIDGTRPSADQLPAEVSKRIELVMQKFMAAAEQRIFSPAPPSVTPAEAKSSATSKLFGASRAFALKYRRDETKLRLFYEEKRTEKYIQHHTISSTLEGFYDELKRDPDAERKYFTTLFLDDWDRKLTRIVKPVVNWPDPSRQWVGEPVSFLSVQLGYPSARGDIQWLGHVFQSTDTGDLTRWEPSVAKKNASDVVSPPEGWTPDTMFIKRKVHFVEPPGETDSPFMRVFVEKNVVELDPGENGTLTNDNTIEVRADNVGKLEVGPIALNVELENSRQLVEVDFQCLGRTEAGLERPITTFLWKLEDQDEPRYWEIFTGQLDFIPSYRYRVRVTVKGSIFTRGMQWEGPWVERGGNGPCMVSVPTPEDEGVTRRGLLPGARPPGASVSAPEHEPLAPPVLEGPVPPPALGPPPARSETPMPADAHGGDGASTSSSRSRELQLVAGWTLEEPNVH